MNHNFKYGLKLWSTETEKLPTAIGLIEQKQFDYIELTKIPKSDITPFSEYNVPYIIHAATDKENTEFGDKKKTKENFEMVETYLAWADALYAEHIILHPGDGDIHDTVDFLSMFNDRRIIIENMPVHCITGDHLTGYTPYQIDQLKSKRFGFCLDFGHAIKAAMVIGVPCQQFLQEFLPLNPDMFHVSDGRLDDTIDNHLPIGAGNYDFGFLKSIIRKTKPPYKVTIETDHPGDSRLNNTVKDKKKFHEGK